MNNSNIKHERILYLDGMETMYTRQVRDTLKSIYKEVDCYFFKDIYKPFYDPKRIVIIDNDNLNNVEFRSERNRELNKSWQDSFRQYRIDNWVNEVLKT